MLVQVFTDLAIIYSPTIFWCLITRYLIRGVGTDKGQSSVPPVLPLISPSSPELGGASLAVWGLKVNTEFTHSTSLHVVPEHEAFPARSGGLHHCSHHCASGPHRVTPQLGTQIITYTYSTEELRTCCFGFECVCLCKHVRLCVNWFIQQGITQMYLPE